ncbi:hypothetical protein [Leptospira kanakyensis]|uniref:Uncharacterized protein n=1 Tax=Leptospira kanakyensis TaxID=2484968 RepID=A0A6N4Q5F9_9LEPT|nr:hypothetical protein [Leptospira kanakyensis]MCW7471582.1 hypothetical protein [Leptospira kanakyensis]MCW7481234.1 hypothetical protein [Leptospira kanakyensis]TGK46129.1 hypothetical protein EHQ11_19480 [Leptospira kanakyensis]TGK65066.1 hypothetical protein EHQ16_00490 [Leptospira kanakyensis]TGK65498.1 hypothetical protein EHQ18_19700 [Leptospira kanakyensis]
MKLVLSVMLVLLQCTAVDKKTYLKGFYVTIDKRPHGQLAYAEKYGYNSECLVLMEGPVPSRMEPCAIGDRRSARDMYQETEVMVTGDFFETEWPIAGYNYALHVNNEYYQSFILFSSAFHRRGPSRFSPFYYRKDFYSSDVRQHNIGYPYRPSNYGFYRVGR